MYPQAIELDRLVQDWWNTPTDELLGEIVEMALTTRVAHLLPYSRALALLRREALSDDLASRVKELDENVAALRRYQHLLDDLGNTDNDPNILFELLGETTNVLTYDADNLIGARVGARSRTSAAAALLESLGWNQLPSNSAEGLRLAISDLCEREAHYQGWGLFVGPKGGIALGLTVQTTDAGEEIFADATPQILEQVRLALSHAAQGRGYRVGIEWQARFTGESLGLPMYVAALAEAGGLQANALVAATGKLMANGSVIGVSGIPEKLQAAAEAGMRRVLVPSDNADYAKSIAPVGVEVLAVSNVSEVASVLRQPAAGRQLGFEGLLRLLRSSIPSYRLAIQGEKALPHGYQFAVADSAGSTTIRVYRKGHGEVVGKDNSAKKAAERLLGDRTPAEPQPRPNRTFLLPTPDLRDRLGQALSDAGASAELTSAHEEWRKTLVHRRSKATVVLYKSGNCRLSGNAPAWDIAHNVADRVTQAIGGLGTPQADESPSSAAPEISSPEWAPHIGTDEAGKGDYFGPLVSAAVYVDRDLAEEFQQLGVRDSKDLSDKRVRSLAGEIKKRAGGRAAVVPINPRRFNSLYEEMTREGKNLNSLLAWGHSRSIGILLNAAKDRRIQPNYVLVDQFGDTHYIEERTLHVRIPVHQRTKAEADIAVAAASILARDAFLTWLEQWSAKTGITLPKGASPAVIEAGKAFVRKWGARWLSLVAKMNFRTTKQVLDGESENGTDRPPPWADDDPPVEG